MTYLRRARIIKHNIITDKSGGMPPIGGHSYYRHIPSREKHPVGDEGGEKVHGIVELLGYVNHLGEDNNRWGKG